VSTNSLEDRELQEAAGREKIGGGNRRGLQVRTERRGPIPNAEKKNQAVRIGTIHSGIGENARCALQNQNEQQRMTDRLESQKAGNKLGREKHENPKKLGSRRAAAEEQPEKRTLTGGGTAPLQLKIKKPIQKHREKHFWLAEKTRRDSRKRFELLCRGPRRWKFGHDVKAKKGLSRLSEHESMD